MFTHGRKSYDLNGTWKFNPDPYCRCRQQKWWLGEGPDSHAFPCFNITGLWDITVPGTWNAQIPELKWYFGDANYVRDFELPEIPDDCEAFLCFDGIVYAAEIYLNGQKAGAHDWGYSPFQIRVTDYLRERNRLFVLVENHLRADRVPGVRFDWNNDGGIINAVKLIFVPKIYIENFKVTTRLNGEVAEITFEATVESRDRASEANVTFEIPELSVRVSETARPGERAVASVRVPKNAVSLWCPESPKLYAVRVSTEYETLTDEIGLREIKTEGRKVLLNGKEIRLDGVCVHSEFEGTGRSATIAGIRKMITKIKELGANFVRCAHYPYAEIFGREMDKAGLLWWEEVPVYWLPNIAEPGMTRLAIGMMREAILRDWNRASLIIWSVSNECAGDDAGNYPYWYKCVEMVRGLDPSRLVSCADSGPRRTIKSGWTPEAGDAFDDKDIHGERWIPKHPDSFYDLFDILSGNVYVQGLGDGLVIYHKFAEMLRPYNKPLLISEFGSMSVEEGSEEYPETAFGHPARHERILHEAYKSFRELPEIIGTTVWCLVDVRVPMHWRWYNQGKAVFRYGLLDEKWKEKRIFNVVKEELATLKNCN